MPASTHTLADSESVCVNMLAHMCKEVWGGCPGHVVIRERARAHHQQTSHVLPRLLELPELPATPRTPIEIPEFQNMSNKSIM